MSFGYAGKRVLVTGAASGIGRSVALKLAREGAALYLTDVNAEGVADTVAAARPARAPAPAHRALD
ncbi:MAG: SDR family NAD(P)-dependent oxidoreductase, partial [Mycobacterium sp.]|nr:SDR family NAD(P)-dependent oxidoreductase [Mycobacterium sp.]